MITQVTVWIEHGETTDPLDEFLDAAGISENYRDERVLDYTVKVDVPDLDMEGDRENDDFFDKAFASLSWDERANIESGKPI